MKRFDYYVLRMNTRGFLGGHMDVQETANELGKLGAEGWELVSVVSSNMMDGETRSLVYYFKRELLDG